MNIDWQPITYAATFIFAFATMLAGAFAYQRSHAAAKFVALGGGIAFVCSIVEPVIVYSGIRFLSDSALVLSSLTSVVRHVAYFGGLALALHTIAKERRA